MAAIDPKRTLIIARLWAKLAPERRPCEPSERFERILTADAAAHFFRKRQFHLW